LSEEEERIGVVDNNGDFKESSEPVGIIREEVVEVTENLLCHQWKIKMRTRKTKLRLIIVTVIMKLYMSR